MSYDACAAMVAERDPDRFAAAMTAPVAGRGGLMALYAFNLEIARAPFVSDEPMVAQMRLQFWADAVSELFAGAAPRAHEVLPPLAETIRAHDLPRAPFERMIAARARDAARDPTRDLPALWRYLEETGGALMQLSARALDAPADEAAHAMGAAGAAANLVAAVPALRARGHDPLPPPADAGLLRALAREGLERLAHARRLRAAAPRAARPALIAAWRAAPILRAAARAPEAALAAPPVQSEFRRRLSLITAATTGRW